MSARLFDQHPFALLLLLFSLSFTIGVITAGQDTTFNTCRQQLNELHYCLKDALDRTRLNQTAVIKGAEECFKEGGCNEPDSNAVPQRTSADRFLQQSPFKNVNWTEFEQCRINVNIEARNRIRTCVRGLIKDYSPDIDDDVDDDGRVDGHVTRNVTLGSHALSKLADDLSICGPHVDKTKVKRCIVQVFQDNKPGTNGDLNEVLNTYCHERRACKDRLSVDCGERLNETHNALCQCANSEIVSSNSDDLTEQFLQCTKVNMDQRSSLPIVQASPQRQYALSFCSTGLDPCDWITHGFKDESVTSSNTEKSTVNQYVSSFNIQTDGQLGVILSNVVSTDQIDRLLQSLSQFTTPNQHSLGSPSNFDPIQTQLSNWTASNLTNELEESLFRFEHPFYYEITPDNDTDNENSVQKLLYGLLDNNTDIERLNEIGSTFVKYIDDQMDRTNGTSAMNIETLVNSLVDSAMVQYVQSALYKFMHPFGESNQRNSSAMQSVYETLRDVF